MWILDVFASAGFGALLGGVFGWLNKREERATLKDKQVHDIDLIEARTASEVQLAKIGIEKLEVEGELAIEKEDSKAFKESQKTSEFGHAIKSIFRPLITCALLFVSYELVTRIDELVGGLASLPEQELVSLYRVVILQTLGLTGVCVGWWFSTRTSKGYDKLLDKYL